MENNTKKSVLIVEDDQVIRGTLADALKKEGVEVVQAGNGKEALAQVAERDFDLIVLDLLMPEMDGNTFYYYFKNNVKKKIPVVVLTNLSAAPFPEGAKDFIVKANISLSELVNRLKSFI